MTDTTNLDDIDIAGDVPVDESVKLNGPPGTGKTTQSAARVAKLIRDEGYHISDVAWVTYRRSLAKDTLRRLASWGVVDDEELAEPRQGATRKITTIHALANRVTRKRKSDVAQDRHKRAFCKDELGIRYSASSRWEEGPGELLFRVLGWLEDNLIDPMGCVECPQFADLRSEYPTYLEPHNLADIQGQWADYKEEHDLHEFHEMLTDAYYADKAPTSRVLVVDEYHDATPLMDKLIRKWADVAETVIVAGDPLQVVNSYQGASPEYFEDFNAPEVLLPRSYRVPRSHWKRATDILSREFDAPGIEVQRKPEATIRDIGHRRPFSYNKYTEEWDFPPHNRPSNIVEEHGDDTMFLCRTKMQAGGVAAELKDAGVIFASPKGIGGWNQAEKRLELYNALQKLADLTDASFDRDATGFGQFSGDADTDPRSVVLSHKEASRMLKHAQAKYLSQSRGDTTKTANQIEEAESPVSAHDFDEYVEPEFWRVYTRAEASVSSLIKLNDEGQQKVLRRALEANERPVDDNTRVPRVYTIHASKGAEAETVVVYDGVTTRIKKEMLTNETAKRNEHRVWYVALTRASKNLIIARGAFDSSEPFIPERRASA